MNQNLKSMPDLKDDTDVKISLNYKVVGVYKGSIKPGIIVGGKLFIKGLPNFSDEVDYYGLKNLVEGEKSGWFIIEECIPENPFTPKPTSITLNKTNLSLEKGSSEKLIETTKPDNAVFKSRWTTSKESVAKVVNGTVTAISVGQSDVIVTTSNGLSAKCVVTVTEPTPPASSKEEEVVLEKPKKRKKTPKTKQE